jgi:hypothetical protein
MRVNRLADVHRIATHFDRQANLPDQIARMGADKSSVATRWNIIGFRRSEKYPSHRPKA